MFLARTFSNKKRLTCYDAFFLGRLNSSNIISCVWKKRAGLYTTSNLYESLPKLKNKQKHLTHTNTSCSLWTAAVSSSMLISCCKKQHSILSFHITLKNCVNFTDHLVLSNYLMLQRATENTRFTAAHDETSKIKCSIIENNLRAENRPNNLRRISFPGSRRDNRSPAELRGWNPHSRTCEVAGGCSWLFYLTPETTQLSWANTTNHRKSIRAPVAMACNRTISAESGSRLEVGEGRMYFQACSAQERTAFSLLSVTRRSKVLGERLCTDKRWTFIRKVRQLQQRWCFHPTWLPDGADL